MADSDLTCAVLLFPKGTQGLLHDDRGLPKATR